MKRSKTYLDCVRPEMRGTPEDAYRALAAHAERREAWHLKVLEGRRESEWTRVYKQLLKENGISQPGRVNAGPTKPTSNAAV